MAKVIVCYKWVLDEADVRVNPDLSVDLSRAKYKISDYDKNSIEAGSRAGKVLGAETLGLSCGGPDTRKSFPDALARGLDAGLWINTGDSAPDARQTGKLIAAAINTVEDAVLVICSEGSSDEYARQTGPRIGALLDWPVISSVSSFQVEDGAITAERKLEDCIQTVKADLPAVLCVLPEAADAPIPGLRQVMMAKKKPVTEKTAAELGVDCSCGESQLRGYVSQRRKEILKGDTPDQAVAALVEALRKEGVV